MKKKIFSTLLLSSIIFASTAPSIVAHAEDAIDSEIATQSSKINDLANKETAATSQLETIQNNIASIKEEASALQAKQVELNQAVSSLNDEVTSLEKRIEKRDASIKEQARSVQVDANSSNIVELVLNADSVSDAVTKVMAASKLVNANNDLMKQQQEDQKAVEEKKVETEKKVDEVNKNASALEQKKGELVDQELAQQAEVASISAEKETEESKKAELEDQKAKIEAQREADRKAAEAAKEAAAKAAAEEVEKKAETPAITVTPSENKTDNGDTTPDNSDSGQETPKKIETPTPPAPANSSAVVAEAYKHLGKPYVWGAKGPDSFDCSGFTAYVYRQATGKEIGGWTVPQESSGTKIAISQLEAGDLVFFGPAGATHHVGIYIGNGQYIHAPTEGQNVSIQSISGYTPDFGVRVS